MDPVSKAIALVHTAKIRRALDTDYQKLTRRPVADEEIESIKETLKATLKDADRPYLNLSIYQLTVGQLTKLLSFFTGDSIHTIDLSHNPNVTAPTISALLQQANPRPKRLVLLNNSGIEERALDQLLEEGVLVNLDVLYTPWLRSEVRIDVLPDSEVGF